MIDGSVLQSAQKCFEKKSRVVVKMVVSLFRKAIVRPVVLNLRKKHLLPINGKKKFKYW